MPNGVLELQRPCALERRLGDALAWTRDAETLALRTANGTVLAMFHKSRYGTFRTKNAQPPQLVLSLLPQDSMPMSQ